VSCAKTAEPIKVPYGMWTRVDTGNRVLQWMPGGFKGPFIGGACCDAAFHQNFFYHVAVVIVINVVLHPFNVLFSSTTGVSQYQKGKTSLDLNEAWTICKQSAPGSRQTTTQTTDNLITQIFLQAGCSS